MEEFKKKLEFDSVQKRCQTIKELCKEIRCRKLELVGEDHLITNSTKEIDELELLWQETIGKCPQLSQLCAHTLVDLWEDNILELNYLFQKFINNLPMSHCVLASVEAVGKVLLMLVKKALYGRMDGGGRMLVPETRRMFNMRKSPHPFCTMLKTRADCWPALNQQVYSLLSQQDPQLNIEVLHMLLPFLKFVLLDPHQDPALGSMRILVTRSLADACQTSSSFRSLCGDECDFTGKQDSGPCFGLEVARFLLQCLPCLQVSTQATATETANIAAVAMTILSQTSSVDQSLLLQSIHHCLSLGHQLGALGMDRSPVLTLVTQLPPHSHVEDDVAIVMVGSLLQKSSVGEQLLLLEIAKNMYNAGPNDSKSPLWKLLLWPLVQTRATIRETLGLELRSMEVRCRQEVLDMLREIIGGIRSRRVVCSETLPPTTEGGTQEGFKVSQWHEAINAMTITMMQVLSSPNTARRWLVSLRARVHAGISDVMIDELMQAVVAILISCEQPLAELCIDVLVDIANRFPPKVLALLPLFMNICHNAWQCPPAVLEYMVDAVPRLACHRFVLRAIMPFINREDLGPKALSLLTIVWKREDRVFPILLESMKACQTNIGNENSFTGIDDTLLVIAHCVYEVCSHRPHQHGKDMMRPLSVVLKHSTGPRQTAAACLALAALITVTREEVVNILSAYQVLRNQFAREDRPMVLVKWCEFLGLVNHNELWEDSKEYEGFATSVVKQLWSYTENRSARVISQALMALAEFRTSSFDIHYLPKLATKEVRTKRVYDKKKRQEKRRAQRNEDDGEEEEEEEEEDVSVPGSCFFNLLSTICPEALSGVEALLLSFLQDELIDLPRRVYSLSAQQQQQQQGRGSENKLVAAIPAVVASKKERNKQPGLRAAYAAGLLFCFEPGSDRSRDARHVKKNRTAKSQVWLTTLSELVAEVQVSQGDWFLIMQMPHAWATFMSRALQAAIEGRCAEAELAARRGREEPDEERQRRDTATAWLWARDKLAEQLRAAVRQNSSARGNAVLALAGLASAVSLHAMGLEEEEEEGDADATGQRSTPQYEGHQSWMTKVTNSLFVALDSSQSPQSFFGWCKDPGEHSPMVSHQSVQSCAALGLSLLTPHLVTQGTSLVSQAIQLLTAPLTTPGGGSGGSSAPLTIPQGVGAGMLLARLCQEHFTDMAGKQGEVDLLTAFERLEGVALQKEHADDTTAIGATLGLGIALAGLTHEGATHAKVHLKKVQEEIRSRIGEAGDTIDPVMQALVVCSALVTAACYSSISSQDAFQVATQLQTMAQKNVKCVPLAVSAGILIHSLTKLGHPDIAPQSNNFYAVLMRQTKMDEGSDAMKSTVAGLVYLVAGPGHLLRTDLRSEADQQTGRLTGAVRELSQLLTDTSDLKLQHSLPWLLGYLHSASSSVMETKSSVPSSYSYLPEVSLLRAAVDLLLRAGRGDGPSIPSLHVVTVLTVLHTSSQQTEKGLPPVNWPVVLSPIMRSSSYACSDVYLACMRLAIGQCATSRGSHSQSTSNFVSSWLSPSLYPTIKDGCEHHLFRSLPTLLHCVPLSNLMSFLKSKLVGLFQHDADLTTRVTALCGLKLALKVPHPPQGVSNLLTGVVQKIYQCLPIEKEHQCLLMSHLADCVHLLEQDDMENLTTPLTKGNLVKGTFVRSQLVRGGFWPLMLLDVCIQEAMNRASASEQTVVLWLLLVAFSHAPSQLTVQDEKRAWLEQLMNRVKAVAFGRDPAPPGCPWDANKRVSYLLDVFTITMVTWSCDKFVSICSPHPGHYTTTTTIADAGSPTVAGNQLEAAWHIAPPTADSQTTPDWLEHVNENAPLGCDVVAMEAMLEKARELLPRALCQFLAEGEAWPNMRQKILPWLINICLDSSRETVPDAVKRRLRGCLYALRHCGGFKENECWLRVFEKL